MSDPTRKRLYTASEEPGLKRGTLVYNHKTGRNDPWPREDAAVLSTTPAPLDVERLARAIEAAVAGNQSDMETKGYDELAAAIAREYAKP